MDQVCALNNFSRNFDYLPIETISNHLPTSMKISKVTFYSLIGLVGQAAQGREQDFEWTNEKVICAEFNSVALVAQNPIFVDVDGSIQDFGQGGLPSIGDQVIANKFKLGGKYMGSDFTIDKFTIQSICTFVGENEAPSCDFEIKFAYCNTGEGRGGGGEGGGEGGRGGGNIRINGNNGNNDRKCYDNGEIFAKGQSSPFAITGGSRRFVGAFGQISGEIVLGEQFRFQDVEVRLCHYKNKPF